MPERAGITGQADYPPPARAAGVARSGRHREHLFPGRGRRVAPTFTDAEYVALCSAAARLGLTPTGFCAHAAITLATGGTETATGVVALGQVDVRPAPTQRAEAERVEALAGLQAELADARLAVVRVGTNLNQAVRALHATGEAPVWLAHVVELCGRALSTVDAAASRVHRRLSR